MAPPISSQKKKQPTRKKITEAKREPRPISDAESGNSREPDPNPSSPQQTSVNFETVAGHINLLSDSVINLNNSFLTCTHHIESLTHRTQKVEDYLSGFETIFTTFRSLLEQQVATQLRSFEQNISNYLESQSEKIEKKENKECGCVCSCRKEETLYSPTTSSPLIQEPPKLDVTFLLEHLQQSTELQASQKHEEGAKQQAHLLKRHMLAEWTDALNHRRRGYWNYILNRNKRSLYQEWQQQDPSFLPMKFRPKLSDTLDPGVTELRLQGGYENYRRNINELKIYEEKHKKKFQQLDHEIARKIERLAPDDLTAKKALEFWIEETAEQEARSVQLWNKKERFLRRKKHEESQQTPDRSSEPTSYFSGSSDDESHDSTHWEVST